MKPVRSVICLLLLSFALLLDAAVSVNKVSAGLYCSQVRSCAGSAGCTNGGSVDGCDLTCTGGGTVSCDTIG